MVREHAKKFQMLKKNQEEKEKKEENICFHEFYPLKKKI